MQIEPPSLRFFRPAQACTANWKGADAPAEVILVFSSRGGLAQQLCTTHAYRPALTSKPAP
jgi:hypothetical protein